MGINKKDYNIKVYIGGETYSFSNVQYTFIGPSNGGPRLTILKDEKVVTEFCGGNFACKISRSNPLE